MKRTINCAVIIILLAGSSFLLAAQNSEHSVAKGETLYGISRQYGISIDDLCALNGIGKTAVLKIGQTLKIPGPSSLTAPTETYIVQKGDTMYSIARKLGVSVDTLNILNQLSNSSLIKAGQELTVPSSNTASVQKDIASNAKDMSIVDPRSYDTKKNADKNLLWPVNARDISYLSGKISGVALTAEEKEDVKAVQSGTVMYAGIYRGFGQVVFVQSRSNHMYVYTGLEGIKVKIGDAVSTGTVIGAVGLDAINGKPMVNFMVFLNGNAIDPAKAPRG